MGVKSYLLVLYLRICGSGTITQMVPPHKDYILLDAGPWRQPQVRLLKAEEKAAHNAKAAKTWQELV